MSTRGREWWAVLALALLLGVLAWRAPAFYRPAYLASVLTGAAPVLVAACGVAMVIIARQIDVSLGSVFACCSVAAGLAAEAQWPMPAVCAVAIALGAAMGAFNGFFVAALGLPSIVVTLATMVAWREGLRWWREGEFVQNLPDYFQWFGLSQGAGQAVVITAAFAIFALLLLALRHLSGGRFLYATGSDADAARLAGLRPAAVTFAVFVLMGALAGTAALLNAVRFADVDPKTGQGLELQAIAAAVVGGISISGGQGRLWGVLAGVLLLICIAPALVFLGWPPQWERVIQGGIILLAIAGEALRQRSTSPHA